MWWWREAGRLEISASRQDQSAPECGPPVVGQSVSTFWHEIQEFRDTRKRPQYKAKTRLLDPWRVCATAGPAKTGSTPAAASFQCLSQALAWTVNCGRLPARGRLYHLFMTRPARTEQPTSFQRQAFQDEFPDRSLVFAYNFRLRRRLMFLVMGITGKVGGATAKHLLAQGKEVPRAGPQSREGGKLGGSRCGTDRRRLE